MSDNIPPDRQYHNGKEFHPPKVVYDKEWLSTSYEQCGVFDHHCRCIRCGNVADKVHRLNWLKCTAACQCCARGRSPKPKHIGSVCAHWSKLYKDFFNTKFFKEHTGINCMPEQIDDFMQSYRSLSGTESLPSKDKSKSDQGLSGKDSNAEAIMSQLEGLRTFVQGVMSTLNPAEKRKRDDEPEQEQPSKRPAKSCKKCRKPGHSGRDCPSPLFCTVCHKFGHLAEICRHKKAAQEQVDPAAGLSLLHQPSPTPIPIKVEETEDENEALDMRQRMEDCKQRAKIEALEARIATLEATNATQATTIMTQKAIMASEERTNANQAATIEAQAEEIATLKKLLLQTLTPNEQTDTVRASPAQKTAIKLEQLDDDSGE